MATPVELSWDPRVLASVGSQSDKHSMGVRGEAPVFEVKLGLWVHHYGLGILGSPWLGPPSGITLFSSFSLDRLAGNRADTALLHGIPSPSPQQDPQDHTVTSRSPCPLGECCLFCAL